MVLHAKKVFIARKIAALKMCLLSSNALKRIFCYLGVGLFEFILAVFYFRLYIIGDVTKQPALFNGEGFSYSLFQRRQKATLGSTMAMLLCVGVFIFYSTATLPFATEDLFEQYQIGSEIREETPLSPSNTIFIRILRFGYRGDDVNKLQEILQSKGFLKAKPTGFYDLSTMEAVRAYQKAIGVHVTGNFGSETSAKLQAEK